MKTGGDVVDVVVGAGAGAFVVVVLALDGAGLDEDGGVAVEEDGAVVEGDAGGAPPDDPEPDRAAGARPWPAEAAVPRALPDPVALVALVPR